jgi:CHAT domain-containing protein
MIYRRKHDNRKKPIIAFGGAVYEENVDSQHSSARKESSDVERKGFYGTVSDKEITYAVSRGAEYLSAVYDRMGLRWENLPGTLEEVNEIGSMFPGSSIYSGEKVNESIIKQLSEQGELKQYEAIHFSTHGMSVPEYPELSALVLSQLVNDKEDGYLCMSEIATLDIEAEFVNLSACETGLGKIYTGEGVVGLTQSFLIAGANGLSVSLWKVADESTKEFMIGMYKKVKDEGFSYAEAIRQMKLEFIGGGKYKNPFYWAPFVYYGR